MTVDALPRAADEYIEIESLFAVAEVYAATARALADQG